ncbi:YopX family protein [Campylobacter upsaliensis]|uniref:YopX family protein n=1 Tax=Campylobacter upsaliensis TaxID=28080 RepID=UPI00214A12A3|nr:YopX family protein [Campylobacter upsaliensis]MCR2113415.1 YopX family protein [Campylobacter upsaliensis]MCR2116082.1 YopX family protein [Campylobacter upsaliensis]MCR2119991.1 YopX family protein [Campylobacter upsaliensis]
MKLKNFDFRIWDKTKEAFLKQEPTLIKLDNERVIAGRISRFYANTVDMFIGNGNDLEIELWSGFYDSKGTKIYEGDIVKYDSNTRPLAAVFEKNTFYIVDTSIKKHLQVDCGTRLQGIYENKSNGYKDNKLECLEVLGNIYENAELLKIKE